MSGNPLDLDALEILDGIRHWVEIESPTTEPVAVNRLMDLVKEQLQSLGMHVDRIPGRDGRGDHLRARAPWGGDGPGIADMKSGAYLVYNALRYLVHRGETTPLPITIIYNADEEVGSRTSRTLIEEAARIAKYVLVAEPGRNGGSVVTA